MLDRDSGVILDRIFAVEYLFGQGSRTMRHVIAIMLLGILAGCTYGSGPASTDTKSDSLPTLKERIAFLERYVTFRRDYSDVGFHVVYRNGGSFPPSPSEWDVRVVATVPPERLADWVPPGVKKTPRADMDWLDGVPGSEKASGIQEWYAEPGRLVGIDRGKSIVAYRTRKY